MALAKIFSYDSVSFRISDLLDEVESEIKSLNPDFSGEQDEINKLLDIKESLENAEYEVQTLKTNKIKGKYENVY